MASRSAAPAEIRAMRELRALPERVPRAHYQSLLDVPPEIGMHLFQVTMKLAGAIRRKRKGEVIR